MRITTVIVADVIYDPTEVYEVQDDLSQKIRRERLILSEELVLSMTFVFFFFQAEDGIRDLTVTGVQTCALPISMSPRTSNCLTHLECSLCNKKFEPGKVHNLCECGGPLLVRYDLEKLRRTWSHDQVATGPNSMWRYGPVLPPTRQTSIISLGEGMTPLVRTARLGGRIGAEQLWVKDEGLNPTGSFKARGLSCAVSMAVELGIRKLAIPSAGQAASDMAAYAAAAGLEAHIFMPRDVPQANFVECKAYGAHVTLVDGLISDCAKLVSGGAQREGWFDV